MEQEVQQERKTFVSFKIAGEYFAVDVKNVVHIMEASEFTKIPQSIPFVKGLINFNGQVIPVIDTYIKFGINDYTPVKRPMIIVLEIKSESEKLFGILVDKADTVFEVSNTEIKPLPVTGKKEKTGPVKGVIQTSGRFLLLLDADKILETEEIEKIKTEKKS